MKKKRRREEGTLTLSTIHKQHTHARAIHFHNVYVTNEHDGVMSRFYTILLLLDVLPPLRPASASASVHLQPRQFWR